MQVCFGRGTGRRVVPTQEDDRDVEEVVRRRVHVEEECYYECVNNSSNITQNRAIWYERKHARVTP